MSLVSRLSIFKNKKEKYAITTHELVNVMLNKRIIPVPSYKEKNQKELIVISRDIPESKKLQKKKTIKL